jgi:hypothetical protein
VSELTEESVVCEIWKGSGFA